ncbi:MAG: tetratricopeptide repeat protein [Planctomycetota bacterium]|jgi:tetratricopeptide (TPR) repeat protein
MWIIAAVLLMLGLIFVAKKRFNNFVVMARNITYIHEILRDEYKDYFADADSLLMTCGMIDTLSYAFTVEDMNRAITYAKVGDCSLDPSYRRQSFEARKMLSGHDRFLNFVLQLEAMMFIEDTSHRPDDILNAVVSQKTNIKRAIDSAKQSYASGNRPAALHHAVSNFMVSDAFGKVRDELGIMSSAGSGQTAHCDKVPQIAVECADPLFSRAVSYFLEGEYDKAIADFTQAIEINPNLAQAYANRGQAYYKSKGESDRAIADMGKAVEIDPKLAKAQPYRGLYLRQSEYDKVIADLTKTIETNPRLVEAYTDRGQAYLCKGEYDKAIADCTTAIEIDPKSAEAYTKRGISYKCKGQIDQSISDYTKAIEIDPMCLGAYLRRASLYKNIGEHEKADADYIKAAEIDPKLARIRAKKG